MTLRAAFSLEHVAASNTAVTGIAATFANLPISLKLPASGNTRFAALAGDGWINGFPASGAGWIGVGVDVARVCQGTPKKSWLGVRTKLSSPATLTGDHPVCWLSQPDYILGISPKVNGSLYKDFYPTVVESQNKEVYLEMGFNWAEKTIDLRINGVFSRTVDASSLGADWDNKNLSMIFPVCQVTNSASSVRDFYWTDNTDDPADEFNGPLGPMRLTMLTPTIDTPTTWTMTGATDIQQTFAKKVDVGASNLALPVLNSPSPTTPLSVSVKSPTATVFGKVKGLVVLASAGLNSGSTGQLDLSMKVAGASTDKKPVAIVSSVSQGQFGAVFPKTPQGEEWVKATIDTAKLVIETT